MSIPLFKKQLITKEKPMRKLLITKTIMLLASVAIAETRPRIEKNEIMFNLNKESAAVRSVYVAYPNRPRQVINDGRLQRDYINSGDCLALVHDGNFNPTKEQMKKLADSIEVTSSSEGNQNPELLGEVKSQVINGTVVFKFSDQWLYLADIDIKTKNQESFHSNLRKSFGEMAEYMWVGLYYSENCRDLN